MGGMVHGNNRSLCLLGNFMKKIEYKVYSKKMKKFIPYFARAKNGDLLQSNGSWISEKDIIWLEYTTLKDKNEKGFQKIYDGSLLKNEYGFIYKVFWHIEGYWAVIPVEGGEPHTLLTNFVELNKAVVVGNICKDSQLTK